MLIKPITYTTFDGVEITENFYFHMSKSELMVMMLEKENKTSNFEKSMKAIADSMDGSVIIPEFKKIIRMAYGQRSADGVHFHKSPEAALQFENHAAYDVLLSEMLEDPENRMAEFINGIVPSGMLKAAQDDAARLEASGHADTFLATEEAKAADPEPTVSRSEQLRKESEARLQGFKQKQPPQAKVIVEPTPVAQMVEEADDPAAPQEETEVERLRRQLAEAEARNA